MPYANQPRSLTRNAPKNGRGGAAYRAVLELVRERVRRGERCWFWRKRGHEACPGVVDLRLQANHRWAFTAHHKRRLMDGGSALARVEDMAPAHRACNARDGLMAQNARRAEQRSRAVARGDATAVQQRRMRTRASVVRGAGGTRTVAMSQTVALSREQRDRRSQAW